jgi:hypothetical protein
MGNFKCDWIQAPTLSFAPLGLYAEDAVLAYAVK